MYTINTEGQNVPLVEPLGYIITSYGLLAIVLIGWVLMELAAWTFRKVFTRT